MIKVVTFNVLLKLKFFLEILSIFYKLFSLTTIILWNLNLAVPLTNITSSAAYMQLVHCVPIYVHIISQIAIPGRGY